jgi:hypothetical protein
MKQVQIYVDKNEIYNDIAEISKSGTGIVVKKKKVKGGGHIGKVKILADNKKEFEGLAIVKKHKDKVIIKPIS